MDGAVNVVTVPDALFANNHQKEAGRRQGSLQARQVQRKVGNKQEKIAALSTKIPEQQQQHPERPTLAGNSSNFNTPNVPYRDTGAVNGVAVGHAPANEEDSNAATSSPKELPHKVDRFGVQLARSNKNMMRRLTWPPEGTLEPLGWGWGGEFRIGTGRDGQETTATSLHPDFKACHIE